MQKKIKDITIKIDIAIKQTENGAYVIYYPFSEIDEGYHDRIYKFDEDDINGLVEMLYEIKDFLITTSKYSKNNIEIKIIHGYKYECQDKNCEICNQK